MKDGKLKSKDFFDADQNPLITFHSTKIVQTGPTPLTRRRLHDSWSNQARKTDFYYFRQRNWLGAIKGTMAFDRKDYGMNKGIPFVKIADRVEVTVDLKGKRVSGPPVKFKQ